MKKRFMVILLTLSLLIGAALPAYAVNSAASTNTIGSYGFRSVLSKNNSSTVFGCYGEYTNYPSGDTSIGAGLYLEVGSQNNYRTGGFDYPSSDGSITLGNGGVVPSYAEMYVTFSYPIDNEYEAHIKWNGSSFIIYS